MSILISILLVAILILVMVLGLGQIIQNYQKNRIGFFPSIVDFPTFLKQLIDEYSINDKETNFYELGCGLGHVARETERKFKFKEIYGLEIDGLWLGFAKLISFFRRSKVNFIKANIFDYQLPKGSVVHAYLGTSIITELHRLGILNGCFVISVTFPIKDLKPTKEIKLPGFYRRLWIYDLRNKNTNNSNESISK